MRYLTLFMTSGPKAAATLLEQPSNFVLGFT